MRAAPGVDAVGTGIPEGKPIPVLQYPNLVQFR
jgi:hypothetical protein